METIRVVIAEDKTEQLSAMTAYLSSIPGITVAATADDGAKAAALADQLHPDVMVFDLMLPVMDGFRLLTHLNTIPEDRRPRAIIVTAITRSDFLDHARELGASLCLAKPLEPSLLADSILQLGRQQTPPAAHPAAVHPSPTVSGEEPVSALKLDRYIHQLLILLGIAPHLSGHKFIHRAIILAIADPELLNGMIARLYPAVAADFDTTGSCVERAIRFSIARSWDNGSSTAFNKYLGRSPELWRDKPSNREFISLLAERIRILAKGTVTAAQDNGRGFSDE